MVSNNVKTWTGSRVEDHEVKPEMSANKIVASGNKSAIGGEELVRASPVVWIPPPLGPPPKLRVLSKAPPPDPDVPILLPEPPFPPSLESLL